MRTRVLGMVLVLLVAAVTFGCAGAETHTFAVTDVWARSTPNGLGAVYGTFTTDVDDELVAADVDGVIAGRVELHEVIDVDGVMRMQQVTGIPLSRTQQLTLKPGDFHVMMLEMPQMLAEGATFPVTFTFASGRTLTAEAIVRATEDDAMHDGEMPMGGNSMHGGMNRG